MEAVNVNEGQSVVVLAMPHSGTWLPETIQQSLNSYGLALADTDWHLETLYRGLLPNATLVKANFHRYAIDANRPPTGESLYPGQNTTGLCPLTDFDGNTIYKNGMEPNGDEIEARRVAFHQPYHAALEQQLQRIKNQHGMAVLYDCHSIRSHISYLFDGQLPDFNIGTFDGKSCDSALQKCVEEQCSRSEQYQSVCNARFKGGWTTRHYGKPDDGIHAIQMELSQRNYMLEAPDWNYLLNPAEDLRKTLFNVLHSLESTATTLLQP